MYVTMGREKKGEIMLWCLKGKRIKKKGQKSHIGVLKKCMV